MDRIAKRLVGAAQTDPDALRLSQISALTRITRLWSGVLFAYLAVIVLVLLIIEDAHLVRPGAGLTVPFLDLAIPISSFLRTAPLVAAALYVLLHLNLQKLLVALAMPDPVIGDKRLGAVIAPSMISDWALMQRRDGAAVSSFLGRFGAWLAAALIWCAAPAVIAAYWWRAMPTHDLVLTLTLVAALLGPLYIGTTGWWSARRTLASRGAVNVEAPGLWSGRWKRPAAILIAAALVATTLWQPEKARLIRKDFSGADLRSARLENADLRGALLDGADLRNARLQGANLYKARLRGANLERAQLQGANFEQAYLDRTSFRGANLEGARYRGAFMTGADLRGARFKGAAFTGARLIAANFARADLEGVTLQAAQLDGARLSNARMMRANLSRAGLKNAQLSQSNLQGATFERATLWNMVATGAEMQGANFNHSDLSGANLTASNLDGVHFYDVTLASTNLSRVTFVGAGLRAVDLSQATGVEEAVVFTTFGDGSVKLPLGWTRPAHWPSGRLKTGDYMTRWRLWREAEGLPPPSPVIAPLQSRNRGGSLGVGLRPAEKIPEN